MISNNEIKDVYNKNKNTKILQEIKVHIYDPFYPYHFYISSNRLDVYGIFGDFMTTSGLETVYIDNITHNFYVKDNKSEIYYFLHLNGYDGYGAAAKQGVLELLKIKSDTIRYE